jgi:hypothetical protein
MYNSKLNYGNTHHCKLRKIGVPELPMVGTDLMHHLHTSNEPSTSPLEESPPPFPLIIITRLGLSRNSHGFGTPDAQKQTVYKFLGK